MEAITSQIRTLHSQANEKGRLDIQTSLRNLQLSLDSEWELALRLCSGHLQTTLLKIGYNLNLFTHLTNSSTPLPLSALESLTTTPSPCLLSHLLRALSAYGLITEVSKDTYTHNRITHLLASPPITGAIKHIYENHIPVANVFPEWLEERKYKEITSSKDLPFQKAMGTELAPFDWLKENPERMKDMGMAMAIRRESQWFESYAALMDEVHDFARAASEDNDKVLFVDVGGGFGQQAAAFRDHFPDTKGRFIVQDLSETLGFAPNVKGLEFEAHDFFAEQPVRGAKYYYLRHILHDWKDEDCIRILKAIVPAMGPDSRIVIDEHVLPDVGLSWQAAYMDITMMTCIGGMERTKSEYENLLDAAGLKLFDVHKYGFSSAILAVRK